MQHSHARRNGLAAGVLVVAFACTSCSSSVSLPEPISPTQEIASSPTPATVVSESDCHPWEFAAPTDSEQVTGWKLQIPVDGGSSAGATGLATADQRGVPVSYVVAPGDDVDAVADRFCVNVAYLSAINSVRREGFLNGFLFAGDTINLDAHSITTVGDQNGEVLANPLPSPIPPQR